MLSLSPKQLCEFYLDGNSEAAFEVFEFGGPDGLKQFLGITEESLWEEVYPILLDDYEFLLQLCRKYRDYLANLIQEEGIPMFRQILKIESSRYDRLVDTLLFALDPRGTRVLAYTRAHSRKLWDIAQTQGTDELKKTLGFSRFSSQQTDAVWEAVLDELLDSYMRNVFHDRQRLQVGEFFSGLRNMLRRDLGL